MKGGNCRYIRVTGASSTWQNKEKREEETEGRKRTRVGSGITLSRRGARGTNDGGAATSPLGAEDVGGLAVRHLRTRTKRMMSKKAKEVQSSAGLGMMPTLTSRVTSAA